MSGSVSMVDGHIDPETSKVTDKKIIQALNTATNIDGLQICCIDYENNPEKSTYLSIKSDIVDLINRQQAENKELKTENLILSQKRFNIFERIEFTDKLKKQAKSEAIKEFAERLKERAKAHYFDNYDFAVPIDDIDNLVKEMVGEQG